MSDIGAVRAFVEWQQDRLLEGKPNDVDAYEEWLRVGRLEEAIRNVHRILGGDLSDRAALDAIGSILHDGILE